MEFFVTGSAIVRFTNTEINSTRKFRLVAESRMARIRTNLKRIPIFIGIMELASIIKIQVFTLAGNLSLASLHPVYTSCKLVSTT